MEELRYISDAHFKMAIKRRVWTIRKRLNDRIEGRDYPKISDDAMRELRILEQLASVHRIKRREL